MAAQFDGTFPLVTVLIDTYNYAHFLRTAIDSVLHQTYPIDRLEILVVDDGSTDDTPAVVAGYGDRIRSIRKRNGGQASALNLGIRVARGEYVALLDADDSFYPDKISRVVDAFRRDRRIGIVCNRLDIVDDRGKTLVAGHPASMRAGDNRSRFLLGYSWGVPTSALAFRTSVVREIEIPEDAFPSAADYFLMSVVPLVAHIGVVEEPSSAYVYHGTNQTLFQHASVSTEQRARQHAAIRTYVAQALKAHVVTYLGRSGYGEGLNVPAGFRPRFALLAADWRAVLTARVEPQIKLRAALKLLLSVTPDRVYRWTTALRSLLPHPRTTAPPEGF